MSNSLHNRDTLQELLEQGCGCKHNGKPIPPPYASDDDMPELYCTPDGLLTFSVPPPDNKDGTYSNFLFKLIIETHNLVIKPYKTVASSLSTGEKPAN